MLNSICRLAMVLICTCLCSPLNAQISIDPALWLDANKGIKVQGIRVVDWEDQSRHQRDLNLLQGYNRADWVDGVDGKKAVAFRKAHFAFDGSFLAYSDYTVFIVEDRRGAHLANFFMGGRSSVRNSNLVLGYEQSSLLRMAHYANDLDVRVPPNYLKPGLSAFRFSRAEGRSIFRHLKEVQSSNTSNDRQPLTSYQGAVIGGFPALGRSYTGRIYELIIFDRALSDQERIAISDHLIRKYQLSVEPPIPTAAKKEISFTPIDIENIRELPRSTKTNWKSYQHFPVSSIGEINSITLFVDFGDEPADGLETMAVALNLQKTDTLASFYKKVSRGKLSVRHRFIHGWRRMESKAYEFHEGHIVIGPKTPRKYIQEAMALFPEIDFTQYQIVNVATPPIREFSLSPTHYYIKTPSGNRVGSVTIGWDSHHARIPPHKILIHEYGHQLGLPDLYPYAGTAGPKDPKSVQQIAIGELDMMANVYGSWDMLGWHQYYLGWLSPDNIAFVEGKSWQGSISRIMGDEGTTMVLWQKEFNENERPMIYAIEQIDPPKYYKRWQKSVVVYSIDVMIGSGKHPVWLHRNEGETFYEAPLLVGEKLDNSKLPFTVEVLSEKGEDFEVSVEVRE
ncbi:MAG: hypothetical protein R8G66_10625 [Cytophagales bacterium]|nr:hypothetical protein [Cytophagales bacterium]